MKCEILLYQFKPNCYGPFMCLILLIFWKIKQATHKESLPLFRLIRLMISVPSCYLILNYVFFVKTSIASHNKMASWQIRQNLRNVTDIHCIIFFSDFFPFFLPCFLFEMFDFLCFEADKRNNKIVSVVRSQNVLTFWYSFYFCRSFVHFFLYTLLL